MNMTSAQQDSKQNSMSLAQWVDYIQTLHHRDIELSLERVQHVYLSLYPNGMSGKIITLSGTNGKGSTAEICASIYRQAGYCVGKFTSPHLVHFNERFCINGRPVNNDDLIKSFIRVEKARGETPITFFEFGTLLAIDLFERANVDVAIMEVGLGGRLDSVNILDCDVAITTSVAIDHTAWLGDTIEAIAYEKAGIARSEKPFIVGIPKPPSSLVEHARSIGAKLHYLTDSFDYDYNGCKSEWSWWNSEQKRLDHLPLPFAQAGVQLSNASLALQAVHELGIDLPVAKADIHQGLSNATLAGRCQVVQEKPLVVLDVSHNEASVARLATFIKNKLAANKATRCVAVCGMLKDKEIAVSLQQISSTIDQWHVASIHNDRGASSLEMAKQVQEVCNVSVAQYDLVEDAFMTVKKTLTENDCLLVFGSFHIVGDIIDLISKESIT